MWLFSQLTSLCLFLIACHWLAPSTLVLGITCDCTLCHPRNFCQIDDGICMTTIKRNTTADPPTDVMEEIVSCVPVRLLFPPNTVPFICRTSKLQRHEVTRECCGGFDYCNRAMNISLIYKNPHLSTAEKHRLLFTAPNRTTENVSTYNDPEKLEQKLGIFDELLVYGGKNLVLSAILIVCLLALMVFLSLILCTLRQLRKRERCLSRHSFIDAAGSASFNNHHDINNGLQPDSRLQLLAADGGPVQKLDVSSSSSFLNKLYTNNDARNRQTLGSSVGNNNESPQKFPSMRKIERYRFGPTATGGAVAALDDDEFTNATTGSDETDSNSLLNFDATSGSGSGLPVLLQRTIARQIKIQKSLGKGRFGEVFLGLWNGEQVAVKVFCSRDVANWLCETEIFQRFFLRHENVVSFIASDTKDNGRDLQHWLIMEYYPFCLYDFLAKACVDIDRCLRLCASIVKGLAFLHTPICDSQRGKPAIAHLDIKTKNILIKTNGDCVIADLGLAVVYQPPEQQQQLQTTKTDRKLLNNVQNLPYAAANLLTTPNLNSFIYMNSSGNNGGGGGSGSSNGSSGGTSGYRAVGGNNSNGSSSGYSSSSMCTPHHHDADSRMLMPSLPTNDASMRLHQQQNVMTFDRTKKTSNLTAAQQPHSSCVDDLTTIVPLLPTQTMPSTTEMRGRSGTIHQRFMHAAARAKAHWLTPTAAASSHAQSNAEPTCDEQTANLLKTISTKFNRLNRARGSLASNRTCMSMLPPSAPTPSAPPMTADMFNSNNNIRNVASENVHLSQLTTVVNNKFDDPQPTTEQLTTAVASSSCADAANNNFCANNIAVGGESCAASTPMPTMSNLSAGTFHSAGMTTSYNTDTTGGSGGSGTQYRMGTSRYAAPEVLAGTLHGEQFESFAAADMYSFALVVWEIATRTYCPAAEVDDFELPYQQYLGTAKCNPSADEMRAIVCEQHLRPTIRSRWMSGNARMAKLVKLMVECWHEIPQARMKALLARKTLALLISESGTSRFFEKMTPLDLMAAGLNSGGQPLHLSLAAQPSSNAVGGSLSVVVVPVEQHAEPSSSSVAEAAVGSLTPTTVLSRTIAELAHNSSDALNNNSAVPMTTADVKLILKQLVAAHQQQQLFEKFPNAAGSLMANSIDDDAGEKNEAESAPLLHTVAAEQICSTPSAPLSEEDANKNNGNGFVDESRDYVEENNLTHVSSMQFCAADVPVDGNHG